MVVQTHGAVAATPSPKPSPTAKATATAKPPVKAKATTKPAPKKKRVVKKKVTYDKKKAKVKPSTSPAWPPRGFNINEGVYAKVPTSKELLSIISASVKLAVQVKECTQFVCGAVRVASEQGCTWWEINSTVFGPTSETDPTVKTLGILRVTRKESKPKQIVTILLVSTEPLKPEISLANLQITCYHQAQKERVPTTIYIPTLVTD